MDSNSQAVRILNSSKFLKGHLKKVPVPILLISIGIVSLLVFLPHLKWHLLIGWDTPIYMYYIHYVERYGVEATFMSGVIDKPLYAIILYMFSKLGADPEQLLMVIPTIFAPFYVVSTYLLLKEGFHNPLLASLAALFSSFAPTTMFLAVEVQPHLLALSCMMIGVYFHLKYVDNGDRKYVIFSTIIASFMLGVHSFAYGLYIAILMLSSVTAYGKKSQEWKRETTGTIACFLPLVGVMLFLLLTSFTPIIALAESFFNPRTISQPTSHRKFLGSLLLSLPHLIFSIFGIAALLRSRGTFKRTLLAWTASFFLLSLLTALLGATYANRFIVTLPLSILTAYGYTRWPSGARLKSFLLVALVVSNLSIAILHQLQVKPWIKEEVRNELIWVRENLGEKLVIPICPFNTATGYWVLGIVGDYIYYGEVLPLLAGKSENYYGYPNLDTSLYWKRLEDDGVFKNLAEYKIVLVGGVYALGIVDEQITEKVENHDIYIVNHSVVTNESKIDYYYQVWRKFKDAKIAVIGRDWLTTRNILYELWISPIPTGVITPPNIQYLGTKHLPTLSNSTRYDILILVDWDVALNKAEAEKLLEYFREGCAIVAISKSMCELYMVSPQIVDFIFGIEKVYPPDAFHSNITYSTQHFVTSDFSIPFNSTGAEYGVPVGNLTTAQGIATVASSEELYLLVVNQRNDTRAAYFGLGVSEMSENDVAIFKKLLLWALRLEAGLE